MVYNATGFIERYLYSLPDYKTEFQRKQFIEIYSYNGLLATRKVIGKVQFIDIEFVLES